VFSVIFQPRVAVRFRNVVPRPTSEVKSIDPFKRPSKRVPRKPDSAALPDAWWKNNWNCSFPGGFSADSFAGAPTSNFRFPAARPPLNQPQLPPAWQSLSAHYSTIIQHRPA